MLLFAAVPSSTRSLPANTPTARTPANNTQSERLVAKKVAAHRKRLEAVRAGAAARLAELEQRFAATRPRRDTLVPELAHLLKVG